MNKYISEVDSTNAYLSKISTEEELPDYFMVCAGYQREGKGQFGNHWESEKRKNLLCSFYFKELNIHPTLQFYISKCLALACCECLGQFVSGIELKWPNDIYYKDHKLGGILIENSIQGQVVTTSIGGIGINVNQDQFSARLPNPISLTEITGKLYDIHALGLSLQEIIRVWIDRLKRLEFDDIDKAYWEALYRREGFWQFRADGDIFEARILNVCSSGQIVLGQKDGSEREFWFKEVAFV